MKAIDIMETYGIGGMGGRLTEYRGFKIEPDRVRLNPGCNVVWFYQGVPATPIVFYNQCRAKAAGVCVDMYGVFYGVCKTIPEIPPPFCRKRLS